MLSPFASVHPLQRLYVEHAPWLQDWLRWRVGCPHDAQDLAQDTFGRLLQALARGTLPDLQVLQQPRAFLATTARRLLIDEARRRAIERSCLQALAQARGEDAVGASPEEVLGAVQQLLALAELLESLSDKARQAFLLYRLDGLRQAEIAEQLGVSVSRVKQYIAQAMVHCDAVRQQGEAA